MAGARATVHGAVSLVNAIAVTKGATLGIDLKVEATVETGPGSGIVLNSKGRDLSSRLINRTVEKAVPAEDLRRSRITITLESEIPTGYGLKSSSAISSAVALGCSRVFGLQMTDRQILLAGVEASIESRVSVTGAYDDACGCYYGGFNVTDNSARSRIRHEDGPAGMAAVIFIPKDRRRGSLKRLGLLAPVFENAWQLARDGRYWEAMIINGLATAPVLSCTPAITTSLLEAGAVAASVSGNGPSVAAIADRDNVASVRDAFSEMEGSTMVSGISNKKAEAYDL